MSLSFAHHFLPLLENFVLAQGGVLEVHRNHAIERLSPLLRGEIFAGGDAAEVGRNAGDFFAGAEVKEGLGGFGMLRSRDDGAPFGVPTDALFGFDDAKRDFRVAVGFRKGWS